ncbi:hypothetical protein GCM10009836_40990 [Pseudonocardia ailaonensis]|uniref:Uncharacterized protein n=1 Tax=Pseudonocardia ailaonensis TaxID=367279 RepID=A0ABN2N7Q0_9PSEU
MSCADRAGGVEISAGALKHGIPAEAIRGVLAEPLRQVPQGERVLYIGLGEDRNLLEIVVEGRSVIHAMRLRPKNYAYLTSSPTDSTR